MNVWRTDRRALTLARAGRRSQTARGKTCLKERRWGRTAPITSSLRPELLARIPPSARRVLDIGCGAGRLGEAVKARQTAEVVGVELDAEAAATARGRLDRVLCGDAEELARGLRARRVRRRRVRRRPGAPARAGGVAAPGPGLAGAGRPG